MNHYRETLILRRLRKLIGLTVLMANHHTTYPTFKHADTHAL